MNLQNHCKGNVFLWRALTHKSITRVCKTLPSGYILTPVYVWDLFTSGKCSFMLSNPPPPLSLTPFFPDSFSHGVTHPGTQLSSASWWQDSPYGPTAAVSDEPLRFVTETPHSDIHTQTRTDEHKRANKRLKCCSNKFLRVFPDVFNESDKPQAGGKISGCEGMKWLQFLKSVDYDTLDDFLTLFPLKAIRLQLQHHWILCANNWFWITRQRCAVNRAACLLTVSETFMDVSSSAFFSRELTQSLRFCLQRDAAARLRSRKRCLLSSGSSSTVRRRRPPVGWAGETWTPKIQQFMSKLF